MSAAEHRELIRAASERLAIDGYFAWPNRTGAAEIEGRFIPFGKKGSGDILACVNSRHMEFEGKTGKAVQSKGQKIHQRKVEENGGLYLVFHTVDELMDRLRTAGYPPRTHIPGNPPG